MCHFNYLKCSAAKKSTPQSHQPHSQGLITTGGWWLRHGQGRRKRFAWPALLSLNKFSLLLDLDGKVGITISMLQMRKLRLRY